MRTLAKHLGSLVLGLIAFGTTGIAVPAWTQQSTSHQGTMLFDGLVRPWDITFLDAARMLVTERPGRLRIAIDGELVAEPVRGLPEIYALQQAGLFEITPHPDFQSNGWLYFTAAIPKSWRNTLAVFRGQLTQDSEGYSLENVEHIFEIEMLRASTQHYGGRMLFLEDGTLLITSGDGGDRDKAQDPSNQFGAIIRINDDGTIPQDNPFIGDDQAHPSIYSYGHRNPQGIAFGPAGQVYANEHGPRGGDEINLIEPGANYGWPLATFGREYSGASITDNTSYPGTIGPLLHWTPSIAPSSLMYYTGSIYPQLTGRFLTSALSGKHLRASLPKHDPSAELKLVEDLGLRWRNITLGPDGYLYAAAETGSGAGSIWRILPVE